MAVDGDLRAGVAGLMALAKADLTELVAMRSVADPSQQPVEECRRAAQWLVRAFTEAGLEDVRAVATADGSECVHGHAAGPTGAPTVLLYAHYDVQPSLDSAAWRSPPWKLTEREDGRWYGRGAADCKGNVVAHLTALRALKAADGCLPVNVKVIVEGSEEQGTGGLDAYVPLHADLLRSDVICVADTGNTAVGRPTMSTMLRGETDIDITLAALTGSVHSGLFGGPTPDPVAGLIRVLASLHDARGATTIDGLENTGAWSGGEYPAARFRRDAGVLDGVELVGDAPVADLLWARFGATVVGIDAPAVEGSALAIQASARARVSLRVPPGVTALRAQDALVEHLRARVPWGLRCTIDRMAVGEPFAGSRTGPGFVALRQSLAESYGSPVALVGQGGSIPLCNVFEQTFPDAEIMLYGVEDPECHMHAPNESVAPSEIAHIALAEAIFLRRYGASAQAETRIRPWI